jgi:hypothetical protein
MRGWRGWGVAAVAGLALLAGCGVGAHPVPSGEEFVRDDFRFVAPTGWEVRPSTASSSAEGGILVYIANQPLRDDCPASSSLIACRPPIDGGLRPGGILITWVFHPCVAHGCDLPAAQLTAIGNRQGVRVPATQGCDGTGSTEGSVFYVTVTPQRVDALFACARDPNDATRAAFVGFLDAIRWRIP